VVQTPKCSFANDNGVYTWCIGTAVYTLGYLTLPFLKQLCTSLCASCMTVRKFCIFIIFTIELVKARINTYGSNQSLPWGTSLPCGVPQERFCMELFCMAKMRYFRGTGIIFPKVSFTLDVI
jgi:hypothetical protein